MITVKVAMLGGEVKEVQTEEPVTVQEVLAQAGISDTGGRDLMVNSEGAELNQELKDGDIITLIPKPKGGS